MKKKSYETPRMKVVKVQNAQVICTSPGFETETLYYEENFDWDDWNDGKDWDEGKDWNDWNE